MPTPPSVSDFFEALPSAILGGKIPLPPAPGVYILVAPDLILYVGEAADLLVRLTRQQHDQRIGINKLWRRASVRWYESGECNEPRFRKRLESAIIAEMNPLLNSPHTAREEVTVRLPPKVADRLRSQAWRRNLPLSVWCGMVLGCQSEQGFDGKLP